jgi:probable HAF family extracellular repeat protein
MKPSSWARGAAIIAALAVSVSAHANRYTLVDLGRALQDATINDDDAVAGTGGLLGQALLWNADHWHKLDKQQSFALKINASGDIAGVFYRADGPHAALWRLHKPAIVFEMPVGGTDGWAYGVNDARVVVGLYTDAGGHGKCFEWSKSFGTIDLGVMGRGLDCGALAINDVGQVTGGASTQNYVRTHAFRYQAGVFQDLGCLTPGGRARLEFSEGVAINNHGDIVGYSTVPPVEDHYDHAVLWQGTTLTDLNLGTAYPSAHALGINDRGDIVGYADADRKTRAAVRFTNPGIVELDGEVENLGRWHVFEATGVNQLGDVVARAYGPSGEEHAVLLKFESAD